MLFRTALAIEDPLRAQMERVIAQPDLVVANVEGGRHLLDSLRDVSADLVVASDKLLPRPTAETISAIRELPERPELVLFVDWEDGAARAGLLAAGALAVLPWGLEDPQLRQTFRALVKRRREALLLRLRAAPSDQRPATLESRATHSAGMQRILETARRVAPSDSSMLIQGETGTGKEWLARAIHGASDRREGPFVAVNCAALAESLLESELFGHERGAFTGAERARRGHFEMAHRGTLFLDEIGDMALPLQAKLLRAVEERTVQRLGSETPVTVDVRILAATHRDLVAARAEGTFRADLYFRLAVVELTLPPLRERPEDIPFLARRFVADLRRKLGRSEILGLSSAALEALSSHDWPGNVRELANALERAVLLSDGPQIERRDLPHSIARTDRRFSPGLSEDLFSGDLGAGRRTLIESYEREYLTRLLAKTGGRVGDAAQRAGIDVRTLREKLKSLQLDRRAHRESRP